MARINEITIYTDFDKTMVKENTPIHLIGNLFLKKPKEIITKSLEMLKKNKLNGAGFIELIAKIEPELKKEVAFKIAKKLTIKQKWIHEVRKIIIKNKNIIHIKLVIITRNIELIPKYFVKLNKHKINEITYGRCTGDIDIISNSSKGIMRIDGEPNQKEKIEYLFINEVINTSDQKQKFIKDENAFYIGDKEEEKMLKHHKNLENIHFKSA